MSKVKVMIGVCSLALAGVAFAAKGEFNDMCVTGMSMGQKVPTDCSTNTVIDGKTYCFSSPEAKATFEKDPKGTIAKASERFVKAN